MTPSIALLEAISSSSAKPVIVAPEAPVNEAAVTLLLNVALPASDISKVRAVIVEPPSLPCILMSLSDTADLITKSEESFVNLPISVPSSLNTTSAPPASKLISPVEFIIVSPLDVIVKFVPSPAMCSPLSPNTNCLLFEV